MQKKVLVTGESLVPMEVIEYLRKEGFEVVYIPKDTWADDELRSAMKNVNGYIIGGYEEISAEHFENAKALEVVAWPGIDYKAYVPGWQRGYELGIAFANAPGVNVNSVAEFTLMLIMILLRKAAYRFETINDDQPFSGSGEELLGKTLGIIGLGRIGSKVAYFARVGFGMEVVYTSHTRHPEVESALGIQWKEKNELLAMADIVSLHRSGLIDGESPEIGPKEFEIIKKGAILINTVKWDLVDLASLYEVLNKGHLSAAAFDGLGKGAAWDKLVNLSADKFVWFHQTGFNTSDANYRASMIAAKAVVDVLNGLPNPNINNQDYLNKRKLRR